MNLYINVEELIIEGIGLFIIFILYLIIMNINNIDIMFNFLTLLI